MSVLKLATTMELKLVTISPPPCVSLSGGDQTSAQAPDHPSGFAGKRGHPHFGRRAAAKLLRLCRTRQMGRFTATTGSTSTFSI